MLELSQLACPCCHIMAIAGDVLTLAELLMIEYPGMTFTSGTRCKKHNAVIGGQKDSGHLPIWRGNGESVAFDATIPGWTEMRARQFIYAAIKHGGLGVGYMPHKKAFHVDRKPRANSVALWKVDETGKYIYFF